MRGHKLTPTCVVLSPDDTTAFSGSKDNSILRWDVETGKRVTMLPHWRKLPGRKVPTVKAHSKEVRMESRAGMIPSEICYGQWTTCVPLSNFVSDTLTLLLAMSHKSMLLLLYCIDLLVLLLVFLLTGKSREARSGKPMAKGYSIPSRV